MKDSKAHEAALYREAEKLAAKAREAIASRGVASFSVTDLTPDDIPHVWWAGNAGHVRGIAAILERGATSEVEYLAVRAPGGLPVAVGAVDYTRRERAGEICRLSTHWILQGLGLGTHLINEAERRIAVRGLGRAVVGVEDGNVRARALYERLGYTAFAHEQDSWEAEREDGSTFTHVADCTLLGKKLH